MNSFAKGFIKRAQEFQISREDAEFLLKNAFDQTEELFKAIGSSVGAKKGPRTAMAGKAVGALGGSGLSHIMKHMIDKHVSDGVK